MKGAKIYRIINNKGQIYYGSTCALLKTRLKWHQNAYHYWFYYNGNFCYSFSVMHNNRFKIQLVERCHHVVTKQELKQRERYYIEHYPCTNKNIPARSRKESYTAFNQKKETKEKMKQYYEQNKGKIKAYQQQYYKTKVKQQS